MHYKMVVSSQWLWRLKQKQRAWDQTELPEICSGDILHILEQDINSNEFIMDKSGKKM